MRTLSMQPILGRRSIRDLWPRSGQSPSTAAMRCIVRCVPRSERRSERDVSYLVDHRNLQGNSLRGLACISADPPSLLAANRMPTRFEGGQEPVTSLSKTIVSRVNNASGQYGTVARVAPLVFVVLTPIGQYVFHLSSNWIFGSGVLAITVLAEWIRWQQTSSPFVPALP